MEFDKKRQNDEMEILGSKGDLEDYESSQPLESSASNADGGFKTDLTSSVTRYPSTTNFNTPNRTGWPLNYRGGNSAISQNIPITVQRAPSTIQNNIENLQGNLVARVGNSSFEHLPGTYDMQNLVVGNAHNLDAQIDDQVFSGLYSQQISGRSRKTLAQHHMINDKFRSNSKFWRGNTVSTSLGNDMISAFPSMNRAFGGPVMTTGTTNQQSDAMRAGFQGGVGGPKQFYNSNSQSKIGYQRTVGGIKLNEGPSTFFESKKDPLTGKTKVDYNKRLHGGAWLKNYRRKTEKEQKMDELMALLRAGAGARAGAGVPAGPGGGAPVVVAGGP